MMRRAVLPLMLFIVAGSACAQQSVPAPALESRPPAPNGATPLDVVVTDKAGHPIPGLQESDFTLLDNGHPTQIKSFEAIAAPGTATPSTTPTQVMLVIDEVNTSFIAVSVERTQLHNFLTQNQGHLPLPVSIAMVTDTGVQLLNQPSTDGNALDAQLRQEQSTLRSIPRSAGFYGGTDRLQISLQSLNRIVGSLATLEGRKLLIWISQGWWTFNNPNVMVTEPERRTFFSAVVSFSDALQRGQITLYAVNPEGTEDAGNFSNFEWQNFLKPVPSAKKADPGDLALQVLATHSGGLVLFGSNDIASELVKCVADGTAWYRLTFDPEQAEAPETWHSLEVKLDKPGMKVRTSNGYYAER